MIKKNLKKFSLKTAGRELQDYVRKVSIGNSEQHGIILGHAYLVFAQMVKKLPIAKEVIETQEDVYGKELADLVLQTNSLLKEYATDGDMQNAAGIKLWNETFRCLAHPELTNYGKEIWSYFAKAQEDAKEYLNDLEIKFSEQGNHSMVGKIREAKGYLFVVPVRYKAALEKFRAIIESERKYAEFMTSDNYEGVTPELAAKKVLYKGYDQVVREKLSNKDNGELDKINERQHVLEKLKEEVANGNITKDELIEIVNSDEYNDYSK